MKIHSFPPIINEQAKVLILGTMPGERSLTLQQYYGHNGNQFWKIMFELLGEEFSSDYSVRNHLLLKNKIGLWDVIDNCIRKGSSDAAIREEVPNDIVGLFSECPLLKCVFFNGKKAEKLFNANFRPLGNIHFGVLPSTSSVNGWMNYIEKLQEWSKIKEAL